MTTISQDTATINLRVKPPGSGFYMLTDLIINLEWIEVDLITRNTYEKANIISALQNDILETDITIEEALGLMLPVGSVSDIYRDVLGIERTNECTLGDMSLNAPVFKSPLEGASVFSTVIVAEINEMTAPGPFSGDHAYTNWQVSMDPDFFGLVASSYAERNNKHVLPINTLLYGNTYYIRAQYGSENLLSRWSDAIQFNVSGEGINRPAITSPAYGNGDTAVYAELRATAYDAIGIIEPHESSDWEIATDDLFQNIVWDSTADTINLESIVIDPEIEPLTDYFVRVRYHSLTHVSEFSETSIFKTSYGHVYGVRSLDAGEQERAHAVATDVDENIFIVGHTYNSGQAYWSGRVQKFDKEHNLIESKKIESINNVVLMGVEISSTGDVVVCGYETNASGIHNALMIRFSNDLSSNIMRRLTSSNNSYFNGMAISPNGDIIGVGVHGSDNLIVRWDANLNLILQRKLNGSDEGYFYDVAIDSTGNVYSVGYERNSEWTRSAYIVKWDQDLNMLAQKRMPISNHGMFYGVSVTSDGDIVAVGRAWNDGIMVLLSSTLGIIRQKKIVGPSTDIPNSVSASALGDIYIAGYQSSYPGGSNYAYVSRYDKNFNNLSNVAVGGIGDDRFNGTTANIDGSVIAVGRDSSSSAEEDILFIQMSEQMSFSQIPELPELEILEIVFGNNVSAYSIDNALLISADPAETLLTDPLTVTDSPMTSTGSAFSA